MPVSGREIQRLQKNGLSQTQVAAHLGISQQRVSQIYSEWVAQVLDAHEVAQTVNDGTVLAGRMRTEGFHSENGWDFLCDAHGEKRCEQCRPPSTHFISKAVPDHWLDNAAAMLAAAAPYLDRDAYIQLGKVLMPAVTKNEPDSPYANIPTAAERAAAKRRVAAKLQGEPVGDDAAAYLKHEESAR